MTPLIQTVGFCAAAVGLFLTWWVHRERTTFEVIDRVYANGHALETAVLKNWQLSHLFCFRNEYDDIKGRIKTAMGETDDQAIKIEWQLKERAFIIEILALYEQVYYHWRRLPSTRRGKSRDSTLTH